MAKTFLPGCVIIGRMTRMKIAFLLGVVLVLGVVVVNWSGSDDIAPRQADTIVVTVLAPDVWITEPGGNEVLVAGSATTTAGSTVRTSQTGRALIALPSKQLTLDRDTTLILPADERGSVSRVKLVQGSLWSRVEKIFEQGESYEVETETMVAAVRGTSFNVTYRDRMATVMVTESSVAVTPRDPATGALREDAHVVVDEGEKAVQQSDGEPVVSDLTDTDRADSWFEFNAAPSADSVSGDTPAPTSPSPTNLPPKPVVQEPVKSEIRDAEEATPAAPITQTPAEPLLPAGTIVLASVSPERISRGASGPLTIRGLGLSSAAYATFVGGEGVIVAAEGLKIVDDTTMAVTVPNDLAPGTYTIVVTTNAERGFSLEKALTVF